MKRAAFALPLALYLAGVALLGDWIIDDAGISFAYARNLGRGLGFVSQAGRAPVEGFSNLLWVIVLSPWARFGWFDPLVASRLLGALLMLASILIVRRVLAREPASTALAASLLLCAAPPLVIWTASGLENGLLLLLGLSLWAILSERPKHWAPAAGVVAGLLAATHPEALLYVVVAPLAIAFDGTRLRERAIAAAQSIAGWACVVVPLFALRLALFHLPLPHTWYAKRVNLSVWSRLAELAQHPAANFGRLLDLTRGSSGALGPGLCAGSWLAVALLARRRALPRWLGTAFLFQLTALGAFVVIDDDWMGAFRFGTLAVAFSALVLIGAAAQLIRAPLLFALSLMVAAAGAPNLWRFAANPPTPFAEVERLWRDKLDSFAAELQLRDGSMFLADVGAPLWRSPLRVIDAAGLCEPRVLATLKDHGKSVRWDVRNPAFYHWLFDEARPTFLATHDFWTVVAQLDQSPRLWEDYVAVDAYFDRYAENAYQVTSRSGVWVRRDALTAPGALDRLRAWRSAPRRDTIPWRLLDLVSGRLEGDALRQRAAELRPTDPNRAATLWRRALAERPDDPTTMRALAETLDAASRVDEARTVWQTLAAAATRNGNQPALAPAQSRLEGLDHEADQSRWMAGALAALYERHQPEAALPLLRAILAQAPDHYGANFQLARALGMLGRRDQARATYQRALELAQKLHDQGTVLLIQSEMTLLDRP